MVDTVDEILNDIRPDPIRDSLERRAVDARTALDRLRAGRENVIKQGETDRWLALAGAMLKPTATGGFGESLGAAATALGQQRQQERENVAAAEEAMLEGEIDLLKAQQAQQTAGRVRSGTSRMVYHPDDRDKPFEDRRVVNMTPLIYPDGRMEYEISGVGEDGEEFFEVAATVNPETVRAVTGARGEAEFETEMIQQDVQAGINAMSFYGKATRARAILDEVRTSGLKATATKLANWLGVPIPEAADITELQSLLGEQILENLQKLTGPKSDFEFQQVSAMSANIGSNPEANMRILDNMIESYERIIDEGEASTEMLGNPRFQNYARGKYERWRDRTAQKPEEAASPRREATPAAQARLYEMIEAAGEDPAAHKKIQTQFEKHFDISDEMKVELRRMGVAI